MSAHGSHLGWRSWSPDTDSRFKNFNGDRLNKSFFWYYFSAFNIGGEKDEDGNDIKPKWHEYLLHFLTFFWKIVGACIPPTYVLLSI
jgi:hypothetical protein